ncbi:hypothetical protein SteCoe_26348 [Stentor coeruleus]|uniref:Histidine kinase n=1 Tax=Stentor coeruleus TaxID=5963 RepID=A0A1R2BD73_9CILI|nr:hypothetical protein SteCoe_26348 [Stentor coeruleus]
MDDKCWLRYWYPITDMDIVTKSNIEYKSGLILLLSILCGLCTVYYSISLESSCSTANLFLSIYFFCIPLGMKNFGRWNICGMAVCIGWVVDNVVVARCTPTEAISLSFYQSLIPSYFILASEEYIFGGFFVSFLLMFSLPFEYSGVYEAMDAVPNEELRNYVMLTLKRTQTLNSGHLLAVFGLTMWMHSCSKNEFKVMNKLLEETKQAKQAAEMFFAAFSHEFRNPLNSLLGSLELIKDDVEDLSEHFKEFISTAMDCGEVLSNLISNVLDVSKIQAQMFQPTYAKYNPRTILHKVFNVSKTICLRKSLTLILEIDKNLPNCLLLDGPRLTQILINLVSNAIKFTEEGYIKIKATWKYVPTGKCREFRSDYSNYLCIKPRSLYERGEELTIDTSQVNVIINGKFIDKSVQTESNTGKKNIKKENFSLDTNDESYISYYHEELKGVLEIEVEDSGIGISDENCKKLFNPFTQANSAISKLYGGTGLGLWISKTITQVYKGNISVKSSLNHGSIFTIQLPCSVYIFFDNPLPKNSLLSQKLEVLLLDNQYSKANKMALEEQGIKVTVCMSGIVAVKYLETSNFHFIFIGINFLADNTFTLINRIKKIEEEKKIPIILLVPENKTDRIPAKFKSYTSVLSPLTNNELCRLIQMFYNKSPQKSSGIVLVLDDDRFILDILSKILEKEKILHTTCSKGRVLIDIYKKQYREVSLVVLDANLDDISGFEVAKTIRFLEKNMKLPEVPIICISGDNNETHFKKSRESGINFNLTKPVKRDEYVTTIKRFLKT